MAKLTVPQIYNAARKAGFTRSQAVVATAIALAESIGGDPNAHNPGTAANPENSWGLWQINILAHPQFSSWDLTDPLTNARAAYAVSNGGRNFSPWSTYGTAAQYGPGHTNSYAAQLPKVYSALGITHGATPPDTAPGGTIPQSTGGGSSSSSAGGASAAPVSWWSHLNPFGWFGSIGSGIGQDVAKVTLTTVFAVAGMGLVVVGLVKGVAPNVQKVANVSGGSGPAGGAAAAEGAGAAGGAANLAKVAAL